MRRFFMLAGVLLALGLPCVALGASFADQSIFLSQSSVTEGDTVRIYATVSNDASTQFAGSVVINDGATELGSAPLTLAAGGAQVVSIAWTPSAGSHTVTASLEDSGGAVVETESANFTVAQKPQIVTTDSAGGAAAVQSSAQIQQDIAAYSPQAAQAAQPVFSTIDALRAGASNAIDGQLAAAKNNIAQSGGQPGLILGTSTAASVPNPANSFWFILWTLYLYLLTIAQFIIGDAAVFYPVLVVVFFYLLYRTYRWSRRPRY